MIVIPAAGEGRRFREAGYDGPKHMLPVLGVPMIHRVRENVRPLDQDGDCLVVAQDFVGKTRGAIDTILRGIARYESLMPGRFDPHESLVVANCDQLLLLPAIKGGWGNGLIFTFRSANTAHSYVSTDRHGRIQGIVEKPTSVDPSWQAVSGVYAFTQALPFLDACRAVDDAHQGAEQYLSAAIGVMIAEGYVLYAVDAPTAILGTPEDFQRFETAARVVRELESA